MWLRLESQGRREDPPCRPRRIPLGISAALPDTRTMTIHHQIVTDTEGRPVVAQIPGEEFEPVRDRLDEVDIPDPWREEIADRAREINEGKVELVDGEDFLQRLRTT